MMGTHIHQQQVAQGGTIRANKRWKNTGVAGTRDILVAYGTGETSETFLTEFGAVALAQYCAGGAEVTTPVDCQVPAGATPGLKNALVGVGKYTDTVMTFDDAEVIPDAIEVLPVPPPPYADLRVDDYFFATYQDPTQDIPGDERPAPAIPYACTGDLVSFWVKIKNYGTGYGEATLWVVSIGTQGMAFKVPAGESRWRQVVGSYSEAGIVEYRVYEKTVIPDNLLFTTYLEVKHRVPV